MDAPETRYASTALGDIAYQVVGEGPFDLLLVNPMSRCIDTLWDYDPAAEMLLRLARSCRLILFDRRGCGISDPLPADLPPTWEDWLDDMLAVLDAFRYARLNLVEHVEGGPRRVSRILDKARARA